MSFLGTQPRITQVPPMRYSSASATRAPWLAAMRAARTPPEPPPMTIRSNCSMASLVWTAVPTLDYSWPAYFFRMASYTPLDWMVLRPALKRSRITKSLNTALRGVGGKMGCRVMGWLTSTLGPSWVLK